MTTPSSRLRVTIDANVLFSGINWEGVPSQILARALVGDLRLVLVEYVIGEARTRIAEKIPHASAKYEQFLAVCNYEVLPDPTDQEVQANLDLVYRDPFDVPIALAAIKARVDVLVSGDDDFQDEGNTRLHQALVVMTPRQFFDQVLGGEEP